MNRFNNYTQDLVCALMAADGYKTGHHIMYPQKTEEVYTNLTPRHGKHAPAGCDEVISFSQQMGMRKLNTMFDKGFFALPKAEVCGYIKKEFSIYLGCDYDVSHFEELHDLGYLPVTVKALPEGTKVKMGVPVLTIRNSIKGRFAWLPNYLETILSLLLWKAMTSATIAFSFRKDLTYWAKKTSADNIPFVLFQGHDFSMRGLDALWAAMASGLGHATSFLGSDSLPVIPAARMYYDAVGPVIHSVNATEHSVMCAGGSEKEDELNTFKYLMQQFPTQVLSIVSDTWDLWYVATVILPAIKAEIMARDGKIVIRPDTGDPADILCGRNVIASDEVYKLFNSDMWYETSKLNLVEKEGELFDFGISEYPGGGFESFYTNKKWSKNEQKGLIELLWDGFGGTINAQGYKVLDPHIGAIYGDAITKERQTEICRRLEAKGFASTNVVFGIGSFTYQYNTRDAFGFAMKATHVVIDGENKDIFKNPITGDGSKKSAKGYLVVYKDEQGEYYLKDQVTFEEEGQGELQVIFNNGEFYNQVTFTEIRERITALVEKATA